MIKTVPGLALLERMIAVSGQKLKIEVVPQLQRPGDMPIVIGCTERLVELGLTPRTPNFDRLLPQLLDEVDNQWKNITN